MLKQPRATAHALTIRFWDDGSNVCVESGGCDSDPFLTADQLVSEGQRVCAATGSGVLAPDAAVMVRNDLGVSTDAAMKIVSGAVRDLC